MPDAITLEAAERALQAAQLAGDADALESVLDADVVYVGPDGSVVTRDQDLAAHRTGPLRLHRAEELELDVVVRGETGVTRTLLTLAGTAGDTAFAVTYGYTRTWHRFPDGWRVLSAHASALT